MKIIREGTKFLYKNNTGRTIQFMCGKCGCIWEADDSEYDRVTTAHNEYYARHNCPTCDNITYARIWMVNEDLWLDT